MFVVLEQQPRRQPGRFDERQRQRRLRRLDGGGPTTLSTDAGSTPAEDAAQPPSCPGPVTPGTDIPPYAPTTTTIGSCTSAQIATFVSVCANGGKACDNWLNDAANATCGNCVLPADSQGNLATGGPILVNPTSGDPLVNTPGCVGLVDKTNGAACAGPLANLAQCQDVACSLETECNTQTDQTTCLQTVSSPGGACATYQSAVATSCSADLADGGYAASNGECQDPTFVFTLYCGGADGGTVAPDAGAGDGGDGG